MGAGRPKGALNTKTKREFLDKKYPGEGWAIPFDGVKQKTDKEVKARYEAEKASEEQAT